MTNRIGFGTGCFTVRILTLAHPPAPRDPPPLLLRPGSTSAPLLLTLLTLLRGAVEVVNNFARQVELGDDAGCHTEPVGQVLWSHHAFVQSSGSYAFIEPFVRSPRRRSSPGQGVSGISPSGRNKGIVEPDALTPEVTHN